MCIRDRGKGDESLIKTMEMTFEETNANKRTQKMDKEKRMRAPMRLLKILLITKVISVGLIQDHGWDGWHIMLGSQN